MSTVCERPAHLKTGGGAYEFGSAYAVMPDRHCYFGYGAEASGEFLLDSARRYWLCTKLWIPTEADAHPPEWVMWEEPPHADDPTTGAQP